MDQPKFQAAEVLPPPSERVPLLRWLKVNLFSTWYNAVLTVATLAVIAVVASGLLRWALTEARWEVIPANLKGLLSGTYSREQLWRLWAMLDLIAFLFGLSGRLHRGLMTTIARAVFAFPLALILLSFLLDLVPADLDTFSLDPINRLWLGGVVAAVAAGYGLAATLRRFETLLWLLSLPVIFVLLIGVAPVRLGPLGAGRIVFNLVVLLAALSSALHPWRGRGAALGVWVLVWIASWPAGLLVPALTPVRLWLQGAVLFALIGYGFGYLAKSAIEARLERLFWLVGLPLAALVLFSGAFEAFWNGSSGYPGVAGLFPLRPGGWDKWGFLVNVFAALFGITLSLPFGILLALGRQSRLPAVRLVCTAYIELIRGVPLISLLFMASNMLPLLLPGNVHPDIVIRAMITITAFSAAYMAENVRGGLQAISRGQYEAAYALGLNGVLTTVLIILPQALRNVIPAIVGQSIALFKDTSLFNFVAIVEVVAVARSIYGNLEWRGAIFELYIFLGVIFWTLCYAMSYVSRRIEKSLGVGER